MFFTTSARTLALGAVLVGLAAVPALADSISTDGADGAAISNGTGPSDTSTGGNGQSDYDGGSAGNGGDGGDVTSVVSQSGSSGVSAKSEGGDGGDSFGMMWMSMGSGGDGGNGGDVELTLNGTSNGDLTATSAGGNAGSSFNIMFGGMSGTPGSGGDVSVTVASSGVVLGNVAAESSKGQPGFMYNINSNATDATTGDVAVTIAGTVDGNVNATTATGTIDVVLDGGVVTGTISANDSATSSLTFDFDVTDRTEYKAATAALTGSGAHGTVTINGRGYSWQGFDTLVDLLRYTGPEDKVAVKVDTSSETTNVGDAMQHPTADRPKPEAAKEQPKLVGDIPLIVGKPEAAKCSAGSDIRTVRQDDGSLVVIQRTGGADTLVGQLKDGKFRRSSDAPDWSIRVGNEGKTVQVTDASGTALSNCSFS